MTLADHPESKPSNEPTLFDEFTPTEQLIPVAPDDLPADLDTNQNRSRWRQGAAALILLGSGIIGAMQLKSDDQPYETSVNPVTAPEATTTTQNPELTDPKFKPMLMTANTAEALNDQFQHNVYCARYSSSQEIAEKCITYIFGDLSKGDSFVEADMEIYANIREIARVRPNVKQPIQSRVLNSKMGPNEAIIVVSQKYQKDGETGYTRWTFRRTTATEQRLDVTDAYSKVWIVWGSEILKPGNISIE